MKQPWKHIFPALACCLAAMAALWLLYTFDNKYTACAPLAQDGAVLLDTGALEQGKLSFPVNGWQIWPDALLAPEELAQAAPVDTYIGQHLTLRAYHADGSPYGAATWRVRLRTDRPVTVSMLVPEAYCASAVYVDGTPLGGTGSVSPYLPRVLDGVYAFTVDGDAEVVIQTSNFTHYSSGLIFPPVLGSPTAVGRYIALRMALYGLLCFTALALALFSLVVWLSPKARDPLYLWFGVLCLAFALRSCYPFFRAAGVPLVRPLYAMEDLGAFLILYCAGRMVCRLGGWEQARWARYGLFPLSLAMCVAGVLSPTLLMPELPAFSAVYGQLVSWYQLGMAALLLALSMKSTARQIDITLCSLSVFAVTQAANVLWNGRFEPIRGAWPEEFGSFVLVVCFAVLMVGRSRAMAAENRRLTGHLQEEVARQTAELTTMIQERRTLFSGMLHDLKSPLSLVQNYALLVRENDVRLDDDQRAKLDLIVDKCRDLGGRMQTIQEWNATQPVPPSADPVDLTALLRRFYEANRPDVEVRDVDFLLALPTGACPVRADAGQIDRILQNLVYNAADFTPPGGTVTLALRREKEWAVLSVADTGKGIAPENLAKLFQRGFTTRADDGGLGLGLSIVKESAQAMGGRVRVDSAPGAGSRFEVWFPLL